MSKRFDTDVDVEEDCITITDNDGELGFDKLIVSPIIDATVLVNRLMFLETYNHMLEHYLEMEGYTVENLLELEQEALDNTEMI